MVQVASGPRCRRNFPRGGLLRPRHPGRRTLRCPGCDDRRPIRGQPAGGGRPEDSRLRRRAPANDRRTRHRNAVRHGSEAASLFRPADWAAQGFGRSCPEGDSPPRDFHAGPAHRGREPACRVRQRKPLSRHVRPRRDRHRHRRTGRKVATYESDSVQPAGPHTGRAAEHDIPVPSSWSVLWPRGKRLSPLAAEFLAHLQDLARQWDAHS